jgi:NAD(P)-dependent dehydrogenase (short-subunit alcohol dehydrogenase family)
MGDLLKGRVAIVTGGGRGLGREHALALAAEGASIVVNDLGVERDGTGGTGGPADEVVALIREGGGEAVANYESVANFDGAGRIVATAIDNYGRLDILVNNAGIFRHRLFWEMSEEDWDNVINVHLKGTFNTCHHAAPVMMAQGYGRIINTTSSQWRNPEGRANYGAAKGGIVSLTWGLAFELRNHGITVNAIAPMGATRASGDTTYRDMLLEAGLDRKKDPAEQGTNRTAPEFASPTVVYLATEQAKDINGIVFRVGSGKVGRYSHPTEMNTIYRDWKTEGPWPIAELEALLPNTLLAGDTKAPFIP